MADFTLRQSWMATLAQAATDRLEQCVAELDGLPVYQFLRSPEVGLTMVRGRAGGDGQPFNLGEMTLTHRPAIPRSRNRQSHLT